MNARSRSWLSALTLSLILPACGPNLAAMRELQCGDASRKCAEGEQCVLDRPIKLSFCARPDPTCPTRVRWGESAPQKLRGKCLENPDPNWELNQVLPDITEREAPASGARQAALSEAGGRRL